MPTSVKAPCSSTRLESEAGKEVSSLVSFQNPAGTDSASGRVSLLLARFRFRRHPCLACRPCSPPSGPSPHSGVSCEWQTLPRREAQDSQGPRPPAASLHHHVPAAVVSRRWSRRHQLSPPEACEALGIAFPRRQPTLTGLRGGGGRGGRRDSRRPGTLARRGRDGSCLGCSSWWN